MGPALLAAFCGLLALAAAQDVWKLRISNLFSVGVFVVALVRLLTEVDVSEWWEHALSFGLTFGGALLLFSRRLLGGGDVKLLAAAALWFDLAQVGIFVLAVVIAGGLLAFATIMIRSFTPGHGGIAKMRRASVPYGVAIAVGGVALAVLVPGTA